MISIYTVVYNKPVFLEIQYKQLLKYCNDNFRLIVLNNGICQETKNSISKICNEFDIQEINFLNQDDIHYCSHNHIQALKFLYNNYVNIDHESDIRIVMDSDIFAYTRFSFYELLDNCDVVGLSMINYFSAIYTMYSKTVNLNNFNIDAGCGDSGSGTGVLLSKYKNKGINHTAPIRKLEAEYIFKNATNEAMQYDNSYIFQFIANCFLHYYRGSGWDNADNIFHSRKFEFLKHFLENTNIYNINLDSNVCYETALVDEYFYKNKYRLGK